MWINEKRDGRVNIQLLPAMDFQPKVKRKGFIAIFSQIE